MDVTGGTRVWSIAARAGIAGGDMHEYGLGLRSPHVQEGGRIHEELPVIFMTGEIERNFFRTLIGKRSAGQKRGSAKREL